VSLDRTGEPIDEGAAPPSNPNCRGCSPKCRGGWLGYDDEYRPIPCLVRRPNLARTVHANDFSERLPSARAMRVSDPESSESSTDKE
jgi:hypothetical protein